jgi:D-beta-D-heptose 7-phosphate kinase/D-beta-D-heptose 1-phosphate adenosyltransferase
VIIFDEDTPQSLIYKLKPDMIVKGGDYTMDSVIGSDVCEVRIFNLIENLSTSKIIQIIESKNSAQRQTQGRIE